MVYARGRHTKLDAQQVPTFTDHLNSLHPNIKFTTEGKDDGALAFLGENQVPCTTPLHKGTVIRTAHDLPDSLGFTAKYLNADVVPSAEYLNK